VTEEQMAISMAFKNTFDSEHGKKVLEYLDRRCKYKSDLFVSTSQRITDFNLGMNDVIRNIHAQIDRDLTTPDKGKATHKEII